MIVKILPILILLPMLGAAQIQKEQYKQIDARQLLKGEAYIRPCAFGMFKIELYFAGDAHKVGDERGGLANDRLKACGLKTKNTDWAFVSAEIKFKDHAGHEYWIYQDNETINFHDWTAEKKYLLYVKILNGDKNLIFLDDIEPAPDN